MSQEVLVERLFETLINGDRPAARRIVAETVAQNVTPTRLLTDLFWPTHELIERLFKSDQLTTVSYHLSTRLLRALVDQAAGRLTIPAPNGKYVFATCGTSHGEELACQMATDLLESQGFTVTFTGGGIPADEILAQVQDRKPDFLLLFSSAASDLPGIRSIVDTLREIGACSSTEIVVGGGVFNRAEGLAEEIGIEHCVNTPAELVELITSPLVEPAATTRLVRPAAAKTTTRKRAAA